MADAATATEKDLLLSQGAHEVRNPVSVILGWVRMLASEKLGPLTDQQRTAVEQIANSTVKLAGLADEMSHLARLLVGNVRLVRGRLELARLLAEEIPSVPEPLGYVVTIRLIDNVPGAAVHADSTVLRTAFGSLMLAQRREVVTSDELCVVIDRVEGADHPTIRITLAGADRVEEVRRAPIASLAPLVESRGNIGFRLSIARYTIEAHGGRCFSQTEPDPNPLASPKIIGATILLPET